MGIKDLKQYQNNVWFQFWLRIIVLFASQQKVEILFAVVFHKDSH